MRRSRRRTLVVRHLILLCQDLAQEISNPDFMADGVLTPEIAAEIKKLWTSDQGIKETFSRGTEFHLVESTA